METIDKKGRKLTRADIDAGKVRIGQNVLYVIDAETKDVQKRILSTLKNIEAHLSYITGADLKEGDSDA